MHVPLVSRLLGQIKDYSRSVSGNVAITFALTLVPVAGSVGAAVDFSKGNGAKSALQGALDSAALTSIKTAATVSSDDLATSTSAYVNAAIKTNSGLQNLAVSTTYDSGSKILTVSATAKMPTSFLGVVGIQTMDISAVSKSALGGALKWPVCVLITNPTDGHTLLVKNQASINFYDCVVQVNTQNWDAVEARDTSYIRSINGRNCFTGDIHYGDVTPPKEPTCDMLADPFATYNVPVNTCSYTNVVVSENATFSPGTYCGGIKINGGAATFSPGVYYIQDGDLQVLNSASVTGNGVTFLISGKASNINFNTTGAITLSPSVSGAAGQWSGFLFYWDQPSSKNGQKNIFSKGKMNFSGILYFSGQVVTITNGAEVTIDGGTFVADELLPDGAKLVLRGAQNSSSGAAAAMSKTLDGSSKPVLVQ